VIGEPQSLALAQSVPNPAHSRAFIRFTLPAPALVSLSIYDLQGRRVAMPLDRVLRPAGVNEVPVRTAGWRPGCYFYRIDAGGASRTQKMVVLE